jgi:hypothetical protein
VGKYMAVTDVDSPQALTFVYSIAERIRSSAKLELSAFSAFGAHLVPRLVQIW